MKRIYEKNEVTFSIIWILIYVITMSMADYFSYLVGIEKVFTMPLSITLVTILLIWINKEKVSSRYGLTKGCFPQKAYLYFIPLIVTVSVNFWGGVRIQYTILETVLHVISMLSVGIIEEIIFRGFLFKALSKDNVKVAIIVSSLTFGFGHIINLVSGAELLPTLLQIAYATAAGFSFTIIFYKSGSLLPCIIAHSVMNATSVFACNIGVIMDIITAVVLIVIFMGYALWILKMENTNKKQMH